MSTKPVTCLSPAGHMILAATGNTIVGVSSLTEDYKEQLELEPHLQIVGVAISERLVFLSILDSLVVYICTFSGNGSLEVLCTMDCTGTIMSMLKSESLYVYCTLFIARFILLHCRLDPMFPYCALFNAHFFHSDYMHPVSYLMPVSSLCILCTLYSI